jgi:hypothetical protein
MILSTAALFVDVFSGSDSTPVAVLGVVIVLVVLAAAPLLILSNCVRKLMRRGQKDFSHFIIHHKIGSGSLARLLKMCLTGSKRHSLARAKSSSLMTKKVFLDS